jgi:CheY-like chemotaxis protein
MDTKTRALLIDDDADYRAAVVTVLEHEGYEVATASGREGLLDGRPAES